MKRMIYAISTYNVVITYPNYLEFVMRFVFSRIKVTVERPEIKGKKLNYIYIDETYTRRKK